jgi:hypothetical protein
LTLLALPVCGGAKANVSANALADLLPNLCFTILSFNI